MTYTTAEGRRQLLDDLAAATDAIGRALAALGAAYDLVDERTADTMEDRLFRPVQHAYGLAKRTHAEFAARVALPGTEFAEAAAGPPSLGARGFLDRAAEAVEEADDALAELQDSMLPVEVGDAQLRAGLADVRAIIGHTRGDARELVRRLGR